MAGAERAPRLVRDPESLTGPAPGAAARATPPPAACDGFRSVRGLSRVTNVALDSLIDIIITETVALCGVASATKPAGRGPR